MLGVSVWLAIGVTAAVRLWVIWGSFFWQDDYVHIWTAWNAPPADLILQNWNGHREPLAFGAQWLLARAAPQVWWPAALLLSVIAVGGTMGFWLMLRRWGGLTRARHRRRSCSRLGRRRCLLSSGCQLVWRARLCP